MTTVQASPPSVCRRPGWVASLLVAALLSGACASVTCTKLHEQTYPPRPADHPISIFAGEVDRPHILLGNVTGEAPLLVPNESAIEKMRTAARELGGDAIIRFDGHTAPAGTVGAGRYTAQGCIVRWK